MEGKQKRVIVNSEFYGLAFESLLKECLESGMQFVKTVRLC